MPPRTRRLPWAILVLLSVNLVNGGTPSSASAQDAGAPVDGGVDGAPAGPHVDRSSPRSAGLAFVTLMERVNAGESALIDRAVECMDVDYLADGAEKQMRSRQLAATLFVTLDSLEVEPEQVPESTPRRHVTLKTFPPPPGRLGPLSISMSRNRDGWRFSEETLRDLPAIAELVAEEQARADAEASSARAAFASPRATLRTFLTAMNADEPDIDLAASCLMRPENAGAAWPVLKHDYAYRLYSILLRARAPVLANASDHPQAERFVWFIHARGRVVLWKAAEDSAERDEWQGEWRFSTSTLASLDELYAALAYEPIPPETLELGYRDRSSVGLTAELRMPDSLRNELVGLAIWKLIGLLFLTLFALLALAGGTLLGRVTIAFVQRLLHIETDQEDIERLGAALGLVAMLVLVHQVVSSNLLLLPGAILSILYPLSTTLLTASLALVALRIVNVAEDHYGRSEQARRARAANLVIPLLQSFIRLVIGAIFLGFVLGLLGFTQAAVLGALGLVGAAVGLAARDTIANALASLSIVYDRPFRVGDWVKIDGLDANVERMGLISVRIRTFYNSLLVVPNSQFLTKTVDNYGERRYRRMRHFLRLRYDTPAAKIEALCEGIRNLVLEHPYTRKDYFLIYLNEFTPSSANVLLYLFFEVPDYGAELRERHRLLMDILVLMEEMEVEFAYPTQRLLIEDAEDHPEPPGASGASGASSNEI